LSINGLRSKVVNQDNYVPFSCCFLFKNPTNLLKILNIYNYASEVFRTSEVELKVPQRGFEPPTFGLGNHCSILLSYWGKNQGFNVLIQG
jgi:hypothetical protein